MKLLEIEKEIRIDTGAPMPTIISTDNELYLSFYVDKTFDDLHQRDIGSDTGIVSMVFNRCLKYTFGVPDNETIDGHPYRKLGLESYAFYELKGSNIIKELQDMSKVHPYYNPKKWENYKHYIITFHDNMFECVAEGFKIEKTETSMHNQIISIWEKISPL
ncbi:hypothetical protein [Bacteroides sp. 51]|uniref:hypothetical protein n=1 Tax=Bacteroides sp. 51 TaxID=2302938 RepID=UPI0013D66638|nr:hypothetical protein [Bacteroides sp. 51]